MNEGQIKKLIEEHADTFEALANNIQCPACKKVTSPPFYNLGASYNWVEGCSDCAVKLVGVE